MEKERYELNRKDIGEVRQLLRISHQMGDQIRVMHDWLIQKEVEERIPKDIYEMCGECCCNTACGCSLAAGCGACFSLGFSALLNALINLRICQQTDLTCIHDVTVLKYGFPSCIGWFNVI